MTAIRQAAINFEAKKVGLSQGQGPDWFLRFKLQETELSEALRKARHGTRFMVALVELDDQEQPINRKDGEAHAPHNKHPQIDIPPPSSDSKAEPARKAGAKKWDEYPPASQAAILGGDPEFWAFLRDLGSQVDDVASAEAAIKSHLGIRSRTELNARAISWSEFVADYRAWQRIPEVVP